MIFKKKLKSSRPNKGWGDRGWEYQGREVQGWEDQGWEDWNWEHGVGSYALGASGWNIHGFSLYFNVSHVKKEINVFFTLFPEVFMFLTFILQSIRSGRT